MIFSDDGKTYRLSFKHQVFQKEPRILIQGTNELFLKDECPVLIRGEHKAVRGETTCYIVQLIGDSKTGSKVALAEGKAHCSVHDNYNKERGRQEALRRAVQIAWPDNKKLWERAFKAYADRTMKVAA